MLLECFDGFEESNKLILIRLLGFESSHPEQHTLGTGSRVANRDIAEQAVQETSSCHLDNGGWNFNADRGCGASNHLEIHLQAKSIKPVDVEVRRRPGRRTSLILQRDIDGEVS